MEFHSKIYEILLFQRSDTGQLKDYNLPFFQALLEMIEQGENGEDEEDY